MDIQKILQQSREAGRQASQAQVNSFNTNRVATGDEAAKILASRPGEDIQMFDTGTGKITGAQKATQDFGFAGNLFNSVMAPISQPMKYISGFQEKAARDKFLKAGRPASEFKPVTMTDEEFKDFIDNPTGTGAKAAASFASALVPGSVGVGKATTVGGKALQTGLSGMIGGGLLGFGTAETGKELEGAATGGITGGVSAAGLSLLGSAADRILKGGGKTATTAAGEVTSSAGQKFRAERLDLKADKLGLSPQIVKQKGGQLIAKLDELGLSTGTKEALANSTDEAISAMTTQADEILARSGKTLSTQPIIDKVTATFKNNPKLLDTKAGVEVLGNLRDLGDNPSLTAINEFRRSLDDLIPDSAFGTNATADRIRFIKAMRESIAEGVKEQVGDTQFRNLMGEISNALELRPEILKSAAKGTKIDLGAFKVPIPGVGKAAEMAQDVAGRVVGGNVRGPNLSGLSGILDNPIVAGTAQTAQNSIPRVLAGLSTQQQAAPEMPASTVTTPGTDAGGIESQLAQLSQPSSDVPMFAGIPLNSPQNKAIAAQIAGLSSQDMKMLQESGVFGGTGAAGGKQGDKEAQFSNAAKSAQSALDLLEGGKAGTGKLAAVGSKISDFFGTTGATQTDYRSNLALARGLAMNALAGANISPSEAERIASAIPQEDDEPQIAKQKLKSFIEQMKVFGGA
jgi:hypothetical protein